MHAFCNNQNFKLPVARKLAVRHTKLVCLTASSLTTGGFINLFHKIPWFFHDYSVFFQIPWFSMHGFFCVIFQVFHDFQSLWEPCKVLILVSTNINILVDLYKEYKQCMFLLINKITLCLLAGNFVICLWSLQTLWTLNCHSVRLDLDPNCLTLWFYSRKIIMKVLKAMLENIC